MQRYHSVKYLIIKKNYFNLGTAHNGAKINSTHAHKTNRISKTVLWIVVIDEIALISIIVYYLGTLPTVQHDIVNQEVTIAPNTHLNFMDNSIEGDATSVNKHGKIPDFKRDYDIITGYYLWKLLFGLNNQYKFFLYNLYTEDRRNVDKYGLNDLVHLEEKFSRLKSISSRYLAYLYYCLFVN